MAKIRNVVKVMNFHALLRVDTAKKKADKYFLMEDEITSMIDIILNNRNFILDKKIILPDVNKPSLTIYFGSDYGFCSNYNALVSDYIKSDVDEYKIIFGKKMPRTASNTILQKSKEDFEKNTTEFYDFLREQIISLKYGRINVVYNKYYSISDIRIEKKCIYPVEFKENKDISTYNEDFMYEGDINDILNELIATYLEYQVKVCHVNTSAAENIMRQNTTNESLKRIDEREQVYQREARKKKRSKEFTKIIEMYTKMRR